MQRNLTLTIDEDLLRAARKLALDRNTSVNQMIREYLTAVVNDASDSKALARRFEELARQSPARIGDAAWTRDEIHERR